MGNDMKDIDVMVNEACKALAEKKAGDVKIISVGEVSVIADYFIVAHGNNLSQITAMADGVEEALFKAGYNHKNIEGIRNNSWILMDYGDVIIHIFSKEDREFYNLEHIWGDCEIKPYER